MIDALAHLYAFFAVVPFVPFFAAWLIAYVRLRDKRRATRLAMDVTTLFLIGSVSIMFRKTTGSALGLWIVILLFLLLAGFIGRQQNKLKGKVNVPRIVKIVFRLAFFVMSLLYFALLLVGIIQSIASS